MIRVTRPGPKPKPPEEKATERIEFACRDDQKQAYLAKAEEKGMALSAWIKSVLDRSAR